MNTLWLPYAPSVNHYWGHSRNNIKYLTRKARDYRLAVRDILIENDVMPSSSNLFFFLAQFPNDRRKRDVDNTLKPFFDAISVENCDGCHGVFHDDNQIKHFCSPMMLFDETKRIRNEFFICYFDIPSDLLVYFDRENISLAADRSRFISEKTYDVHMAMYESVAKRIEK